MRVAAVDLGTNSTRLLVADVASRRGELVTLERRMTITRLGEGVDQARVLTPAAITRTVDAVRDYREGIDSTGEVARIRATATSAARDAANRGELFAAVREVLGVEPELLSGEEEASLSFLGATVGLEQVAPPPYLVVDIGGGSTELVVGTLGPEGFASIDVGCVRVSEAWLRSDPPAPEELSEAVQVVREHLVEVARDVPAVKGARTLVGLAGTVTTVAAVELGLAEYDRDRIHHLRLGRAAVEDVFRTLATEPADLRRHNPGLEPGRVDVIVGGVVVLVTVLRTLGFDELLVSEADILDGLARSLLPS